MTTLVLRVGVGARPGKGSPLDALELDTNFTNLDTSIGGKLDTPAGTNGQILRYTGTVWDGTDLLKVLDNGKVGIGITVPLTKIDVHESATAAYTAPLTTTVARFARDAGVSLEMMSTVDATISFGDVASNNVGRISYEHSDNSMKFWTDSTERLIINGSGFVGIGVAAPLTPLHVAGEFRLTNTGTLVFADKVAASSGLTSHVNLHSNKYGFGVTESTTDGVTVGALELCSNRDFKFSSNEVEAAKLTATGDLTAVGSMKAKASLEAYPYTGALAIVPSFTTGWTQTAANTHQMILNPKDNDSYSPALPGEVLVYAAKTTYKDGVSLFGIKTSQTIISNETAQKSNIELYKVINYNTATAAHVKTIDLDAATGDISAVTFTGSGANLTNVPNSLPSATVNQVVRSDGTNFESVSSLVIKSDGNVGIGIADPQYRLQVSGGYIVNFGSGDVNTNTTFGDGALGTTNTGGANTAIGNNTLSSNTSGNSNTAIGARALRDNTAGRNNIAIGAAALLNNIGVAGNDQRNIAIGNESLKSNTEGINNLAFGQLALELNLTGNTSIALGYKALRNSTDGQNISIGNASSELITTGQFNVVMGINALETNTAGDKNVAMGREVLKLCTGTKNIAIGDRAGSALVAASSNTIIGNISGTADLVNTVIIAAGSAEKLRILPTGYMGIGTSTPSQMLDVNGTVKATSFSGSGINLTNLPVQIPTDTATTNQLLRFDGTDWSGTSSIVIETGGDVGIGVVDPVVALDIRRATAACSVNIQSAAGGTNSLTFGGVGATSKSEISENTGIVTHSALGKFSFKTFINDAYTERFAITNSGQVSIGSFVPSNELDIRNSGTPAINIESTTVGNTATLSFGTNQLNAVARNLTTLIVRGENTLSLRTQDTARITIDNIGNVGIGTTTPLLYQSTSKNLHISGVQAGLWIESTTASTGRTWSLVSGTDGDFRFASLTNSVYEEYMRISHTTGNVGIGTSTPERTLTVAGEALIDSNVFINSGSVFLNGPTLRTVGITNPASTSDLLLKGQNTRFETNAGAETMRITPAGQLLIGSTTSSAENGVIEVSRNTDLALITLTNSKVTPDANTIGMYAVKAGTVSSNLASIPTANGANGYGQLGTSTLHSMSFITNNLQRMTIAKAGQVYIGSEPLGASLLHKLDVGGNIIVGSHNVGSAEGGQIDLRSGDGLSSWVIDTNGTTSSSNTAASFRIFTTLPTSGDMIIGYLNANQSAAGPGAYSTGSIKFYTGNRERITTNGNGTTSFTADDTATDFVGGGLNRPTIRSIASPSSSVLVGASRNALREAARLTNGGRLDGPYSELFGANESVLNTSGGNVSITTDTFIDNGKMVVQPSASLNTTALILKTNTIAAATAGQQVIVFQSSSGVGLGSISVKTATTPRFVNAASDERLKERIRSVDPSESMAKIEAVRVVDFDIYEHIFDRDSTSPIATDQRGVIAQEYRDNYPDGVMRAVEDDPDSLLSVGIDHEWDLLNAVKYLKAEVDSLKEEVRILKGQ